MEELQACVGISYEGYEEQIKALLVAIEARWSTALKSAVKKDRELKRLKCSINYDNKEGSVGRDRLNGRAFYSSHEA